MITGELYVRLTVDPETGSTIDRRKLAVLERCPDGAQVVVDIGRRQYVSQDAAVWLHEHDHRLSITIRGEHPEAIARFVAAARAGEWSVVA